MLCLSRRCNERLVLIVTEPLPVGTEIVLTVTETRINSVRLGISCPMEINIVREELLEKQRKAEHA